MLGDMFLQPLRSIIFDLFSQNKPRLVRQSIRFYLHAYHTNHIMLNISSVLIFQDCSFKNLSNFGEPLADNGRWCLRGPSRHLARRGL